MKAFFTALYFAFFALHCFTIDAQTGQWKIIKPSNTGIPGSLVRFGKFDPQGNLWVAARYSFWDEGGISKFDGTKWTVYSDVDSWMPTPYVNDVAFQGNIVWIATNAGLVRFDGTTTQVFDMSNAPFPSNEIRQVCLDGLGNLWLLSKSATTTAHGVIKYNGSVWTVYNTSNSGIPSYDITAIGINPNNNHLWVGTWAMGVAKFNGSTWTLYNSSNGFTAGEISGFAFKPNGEVWLTASGYGIWKFSSNTWQNVPALPNSHSYSTIALHPDGTLWFGTYGGLLVKYDGTSFSSFVYGNHLYSISFDPQGNVWAGGLAHIRKYENGVNTLTYNCRNTALTSYWIDGIDFAPGGTAWFATSGGGACSFDGTRWRGFNPDNEGSEPWTFPHNSANDVMVEQQNGKVWIASNGVGYWNGSGWTIFNLSNSNIPDNAVNTLAKDNQGRIWIGTDYGAAYYNGTVWTQLHFGLGTTSDMVNAIAAAPDGSIWFATDYGLHKTTDAVNFVTYLTSNSGIPGNYVNALAFEPNGTLWTGTDQGLAKLSGNTWTVYNQTNSGLPANFVSDVIVSPAGSIWAAAFNVQTWPYYGGIAQLKNNTWTTFTPANSPLTHIQVEKLKLDPLGKLWISTYSEGLMVYTPPNEAVLPLDLLSFTGKRLKDVVELKWETASQRNTNMFQIERGTDPRTFRAIGSVDAGNTARSSYSFMDQAPVKGTGYYRLKIIDADGSNTCSKVIRLTGGTKGLSLELYPNPALSVLTVNYTSDQEKVIISLFDAAGRLVQQETKKNTSKTEIRVGHLKPGVYLVEVRDAESRERSMFVK